MPTPPSQPAIPRPAVAGVLRADGRILLARRNPQLRFMGGHFAFPGGSVDADDNGGHDPAPNRDTAADITALTRELFEETGLLIVTGTQPPSAARRSAREAILAGTLKFPDFLAEHGLRVDPQRFRRAGLFVTPETLRRRFHARYYLVEGVQPGDEELIPGEIVALEWMLPDLARQRWRQKEIEVAPPVATVLKHFAVFPVDAALERLGALEPMTGDHAHCHEARIGIRVMPLRTPTLPPAAHTNCLIVGERELFIIDPGATAADEQQRLIVQLEHLVQHDNAKLVAVLLTHGHGDHVGAATLLRDRFHTPIWAHDQTASRVKFPIDRLLNDDEAIEVSGDPPWNLRCLYTPGHHPGHLCFLEETSGTLICGDMVAGRSSIVIAHGRGGDMSAYLNSMHRLLDYDFDLMIPSHGMSSTNPQKIIQKQIDHRHLRERRVQAAWDAGYRNIDELLEASYDDVPRDLWKYARDTLKAHLVRLGINQFEEETEP